MMTSKDFVEALEQLGFEPYPYHGRGMYGSKACVAVTVPNRTSAFSIGYQLCADGVEHPGDPDYDAMGFDTVLYWTTFTWPEDLDEDEE
jgi:hypothetical protein